VSLQDGVEVRVEWGVLGTGWGSEAVESEKRGKGEDLASGLPPSLCPRA
jgi:hypothetical protein